MLSVITGISMMLVKNVETHTNRDLGKVCMQRAGLRNKFVKMLLPEVCKTFASAAYFLIYKIFREKMSSIITRFHLFSIYFITVVTHICASCCTCSSRNESCFEQGNGGGNQYFSRPSHVHVWLHLKSAALHILI